VNESPKNLGIGQTPGEPDSTARIVRAVRCGEMESLAVLYACDELDASERAAVDAHVTACPSCAAVLLRETRLRQAVASIEPPADSLDRSGLLLAQCRSELGEALDDRQALAGRTAWPAVLSPYAWWEALRHTLIYHPALSMSVMLVAGFLAGVAGQRLPLAQVAPPPIIASRPLVTDAPVSSAQTSTQPKVTDEQLRNAESAQVTWITPPGSSGRRVQVQVNSPNPMEIIGAPDDADVQRALTFLLENGQRFDPDVRLDSLDVLRMNAADPDVCRTLCDTARLDRNPAVRRKALDALQGFERNPMVRDALLDAIESDADPGVRVEGIHLILASLQAQGAGARDPQVVEILRDRLRSDPSPAVRRHSAEALRQLGEPSR
jgi:HEAT repeat protein